MIRPHKVDYWLNPKIDCLRSFLLRVSLLCWLYIQAAYLCKHANTIVLSMDEKTGIPAISRNAPDLAAKAAEFDEAGTIIQAAKNRRIEYGYARHGSTTLRAATDIHTGKIIYHEFGPTNKEADYLTFVQQVVAHCPKDARIIMVHDNYSTHKSESLTKWIAQQVGFDGDLGKKGKKGILKSTKSRQVFLEKSRHRIQFFFTPKHCSWMNPIEIWFGKLQRHALNKASFQSIEQLQVRISKYVHFFNRTMAKPLNWKCDSKRIVKLFNS